MENKNQVKIDLNDNWSKSTYTGFSLSTIKNLTIRPTKKDYLWAKQCI